MITTKGIEFSSRTMKIFETRQVSKEDQDTFAAILEKRMASKQNDAAFLSTLNEEEIDSLIAVHKFVELNIYGLSEEGMRNLLTPPGYEVDINKDGLYDIGKAKVFAFPGNDAPQEVLDAYENMSMKERITLFAGYLIQEIKANAYQDAQGHWRVRRHGEPGYVSILNQPNFSYAKLADLMLEELEFQKKFMSQQEYWDALAVFEKFKLASQRT
ncbi:hypothetical protein [Lysinibacillus sp. 54212]|uniref:hypothetical protein n=1 Tax=Lysinibacillus sp. 54212 TaxID=3119829 RepID=UPI002FCA7F1D